MRSFEHLSILAKIENNLNSAIKKMWFQTLNDRHDKTAAERTLWFVFQVNKLDFTNRFEVNQSPVLDSPTKEDWFKTHLG